MRTIFLIGILLFVSTVTLAQEEEDADDDDEPTIHIAVAHICSALSGVGWKDVRINAILLSVRVSP